MIDLYNYKSNYKNKNQSDARRNSFHFVFVSKYRYNTFRNITISEIVKDIFNVVSQKYNIKIHTQETDVDHIHLFLELPTTMCVQQAICLLKSNTAHNIFTIFPGFKKRYPKGHFWSKYTYYESIGKVTSETVKKYIDEGQKKFAQLHAN
jgi:putative transposase